jgi:hypothetical protein
VEEEFRLLGCTVFLLRKVSGRVMASKCHTRSIVNSLIDNSIEESAAIFVYKLLFCKMNSIKRSKETKLNLVQSMR